MTDKQDWYHLVDDVIIARRLSPKPTLRCMCCHESYVRGSFRCCAPPAGWPSQMWLALSCPSPSQGGCGKCWKHCQCEGKEERRGRGPLASIAQQFLDDLRKLATKAGG